MKAQNITVDINKMDTEELEVLASFFYHENEMNICKQINDRIAFLNGWMSKKKEEEYFNRYC